MFLRLQQLDEENSELRSCVPCLRANIERLEEVRETSSPCWLSIFLLVIYLLFMVSSFVLSCYQEKMKLQDETEAMTDRLMEEMESRRKMGDKLSHERHQNHKEKECTQEVGVASTRMKLTALR